MVALPRFRIVSLMLVAFLGFYTLAPFSNIRPAAHATDPPAPPLAYANDPMGQAQGDASPEITVDVDARDGHVTVRVVDIWGPQRKPLVVRTYTNVAAQNSDLIYNWHFNHHLDIIGTSVLEEDGTRSTYNFSHDEWSGDQQHLWKVYVKNIGSFSTMKMHHNCSFTPGGRPLTAPRLPLGLPQTRPSPPPPGGVQPAPLECTWDNTHAVYLPEGVVRNYLYGKIQTETDANGNVVTYTWTSFGDGLGSYLTSARDPVGRQMTYEYERFGEPVCVRENDNGICIEWRYNYRVRLARDPYGRVATYGYAGNTTLIQSVLNAAGKTTSYSYTNLLTAVTNARNFPTMIEWQYDTGPGTLTPRVKKVTAPDSMATLYAYTRNPSDLNRVLRTVVTNARGYSTTLDLYEGTDSNQFGNVKQITDPLGNVTQYLYDSRHNVTQITDPRLIVTKYEYTAHNQIDKVIHAFGVLNLETDFWWDEVTDDLKLVRNPRGILTRYAYDTKHNLLKVTRAEFTPDEAITEYSYHPWGAVSMVKDARGNPTTLSYNAKRLLEVITPPAGGPIRFSYNLFDDRVTRSDGNNHTWSTTYDASRLVLSETDPLNNVTRFEYDANGNQINVWDPKNQLTRFFYDARDRLDYTLDPKNGKTDYDYDQVGNLTKVTNARNYFATFTYDPANRLIEARDFLTQLTTYRYDPYGNVREMTDRNAILHVYQHDEANRLRQVIAGGLTILHEYDANGNRTKLTDSTGITRFDYDWQDRVIKTTYPDGKTVQFAYNKVGNRVSFTNPGQLTALYSYDPANRLMQISQANRSWTFTYDPGGNRIRMTAPNGTSTDYSYLSNNWLSSIVHRRQGGVAFQTISYTYDPNGNRKTQADPTGTTTFSYDELNRLTAAVYPGGFGSYTWQYDAVGNRTRQTGGTGPFDYNYDANNRLLGDGKWAYSYDGNGNLERKTPLIIGGPSASYTYDVFNRLISATVSGQSPVTFAYNGDGLKVSGSGKKYYYDGIFPIWETNTAGNMLTELERDGFGNLLARREAGGNRYYYHADGVGSITAVTSNQGSVAATMFYDAWGNLRTSSGTALGNYRYTGAELDSTTGLYHMGARFYDPGVGRWLTEDPVRGLTPATLNYYHYASANPMILTDPSGTCDQQCLEDLNARRQELAKKAKDADDYVKARELARALEAALGRDRAHDVAEDFLAGLAAGMDDNTALATSLGSVAEELYASVTNTFELSPRQRFIIRTIMSGLFATAAAAVAAQAGASFGVAFAVSAVVGGLIGVFTELSLNPNATWNDLAKAFGFGVGSATGRVVTAGAGALIWLRMRGFSRSIWW